MRLEKALDALGTREAGTKGRTGMGRQQAHRYKQTESGLKICTSCEKQLPSEMFAARKATKKDGKAPMCKDCVRAYQRVLRLRKREAADSEYKNGLKVRLYDLITQASGSYKLAADIAPDVAEGLLADG